MVGKVWLRNIAGDRVWSLPIRYGGAGGRPGTPISFPLRRGSFVGDGLVRGDGRVSGDGLPGLGREGGDGRGLRDRAGVRLRD